MRGGLHTLTGDLAPSTSGGSGAKVGTETEWVELSGTRLRAHVFPMSQNAHETVRKDTKQVFPTSSVPFNLETNLDTKKKKKCWSEDL